VTVTELGARGVTSAVRVIFYDPEDRVIFRGEGVLQRGQPVHVELPLDMSGPRVQARASIRLVGQVERNTLPVMTLESLDPLTLTIEPRILCAPPAGRQGPVLPLCPEVVTRSFAAAE
jgi:hypothetical protein